MFILVHRSAQLNKERADDRGSDSDSNYDTSSQSSISIDLDKAVAGVEQSRFKQTMNSRSSVHASRNAGGSSPPPPGTSGSNEDQDTVDDGTRSKSPSVDGPQSQPTFGHRGSLNGGNKPKRGGKTLDAMLFGGNTSGNTGGNPAGTSSSNPLLSDLSALAKSQESKSSNRRPSFHDAVVKIGLAKTFNKGKPPKRTDSNVTTTSTKTTSSNGSY
jgi:hypothetical protein